MSTNESKNYMIEVIEKIQYELKEIELLCSDYVVREKVSKLLDYINQETADNRALLLDKLLRKIKLTKQSNPELNINFYILYRNLLNHQISTQEAQDIYDTYAKEL